MEFEARNRDRFVWRSACADNFSNLDDLLSILDLEPAQLNLSEEAARSFRLRVPRGFVDRMRRGDPADPLLRQILPVSEEVHEAEGFVDDPVGDHRASPIPGIVHKYRGRLLLMVTGACGIHCRYCFRRHFPYAENTPTDWQQALDYIRAGTELTEVILSGGDPLSTTDERLQRLANDLEQVPHLRRLRIHSRMPVVVPERVTDEFLEWFAGGRLRPILVLHVNHPREIDDSVRRAVQRLSQAGVVVYNQAVLLAGVNDQVETLCQLSETLFEAGIQPYYLHLLDRVRGSAHFEVSESTARELALGIARRLPGYLVPRLVREVAGAEAKVAIRL